MIVKCIKDINKHNIHFIKGDMCVVTSVNDKLVMICDVDHNKGLTIEKKNFKNYFKNEK